MSPTPECVPTQRTLVIDVGGTNVKFLLEGDAESKRFPSGPTLTPAAMVSGVRDQLAGVEFDRITIGFPAPIVGGKATRDPVNLGAGWTEFDFETAFEKPVRVINDAALQAIGSYDGGKMLFLGLGTGLGSAMVIDHVVLPLEFAHLPYRKKQTYEDFVGHRGLERLGKKKWHEAVADVVDRLSTAVVADYVVLGGGNAKKLKSWPEKARKGDNAHAFTGGLRLWSEPRYRLP